MKKSLKLALLGTGILTGAMLLTKTVSATSNNGFGFERMLTNKAEILGITMEELKNELNEKPFFEIAEEKGISLDELHEKMEVKVRARWEEVGLSEEEIAERLKAREERHANCEGGENFKSRMGKRSFRQ